MSAVNHFVHGPLTPVLAYVMSCMGSMLGLRLTAQAHASRGASRMRWLLGAAISIGGTGIWVMHFVAMMGFEVEGTQIKYDVPLTVASAVVAIVVVGTGLFLVSYGGGRVLALLGGGLLTGLGVAVSGMHYTGMYAMLVTVDAEPTAVAGADALDFLVPLMTVISLITLTMLLMVILSPSEEELHEDAELVARLELRRRATHQQQTLPAPPTAPAPPQQQPVRQRSARPQPVFGAPVPEAQPIFGAPGSPQHQRLPQQQPHSQTRRR